MSRNDVTFFKGLVAALAVVMISGQAFAQDRADVLERIKPVGQVTVAGQAAPAAPAAQPTEAALAAEAPAQAASAPAAPTPAAAPAAAGGDGQALAQAKGCLACHQVAMKVVGPAYKDVAAKYKGDAAALDALVKKVHTGGVGTWGQIPMPPQVQASEDEIRTIVSWVLSL